MLQHPQHGLPALGDGSPSGSVWYPPGGASTPIPQPTRNLLTGERLPSTVEGSLAWHYDMAESMARSAHQHNLDSTHDAEKSPSHDRVHASGARTLKPTKIHAPAGPGPQLAGAQLVYMQLTVQMLHHLPVNTIIMIFNMLRGHLPLIIVRFPPRSSISTVRSAVQRA